MELSEEEKKAIEYIKEFKNEVFEGVGNKSTMAKNIDILLNLIKSQQKEIEKEKQYTDFYKDLCNKQQKEIEEKNCLIDLLQHRIEELLDNKKEINYIKPIDIPVHNYISKDKIEEKIEEARKIRWHTPKLVIEYFEELLEEN